MLKEKSVPGADKKSKAIRANGSLAWRRLVHQSRGFWIDGRIGSWRKVSMHESDVSIPQLCMSKNESSSFVL